MLRQHRPCEVIALAVVIGLVLSERHVFRDAAQVSCSATSAADVATSQEIVQNVFKRMAKAPLLSAKAERKDVEEIHGANGSLFLHVDRRSLETLLDESRATAPRLAMASSSA